jgi:hypothetical protein
MGKDIQIKSFRFVAAAVLGLFALGPVLADDYAIGVVGPFGGLNNTDDALIIPTNKAQDLLNVEVSPGGRSVLKRHGYGIAATLAVTTSPVHGIYNFFDASGNSVDLYFNDTRMSGSVAGGAVTVLFSTGSSGATYQCVDSQGFAYCNSTARSTLIKTNGSTYSTLSLVNSTGTLIAVTPERLVTSGFSEAPSRIDFSKANDFTTWVVGGNPTDPTQYTIVAPGSRITHIVYAFGRIIWFKNSSFGYVFPGDTLDSWQIRTISPTVGTLDNASIYVEGHLYFRGQDGHIYDFDGSNYQKMTRDISGTISTSQSRGSGAWTITTQSEFQTGVSSPTGSLSTSLAAGSVVCSSFTVTHTSTADFSGTTSNVSVATGSVYLTTNNAGSVTNNGFESGSGTTADNWAQNSQWERTASQATKCGTVSPSAGSWFIMDTQNGNSVNSCSLYANLVRASDGSILSTTTVTAGACSWATGTISSSTFAGMRVKLRFQSSCSDGNSVNLQTNESYILGGDITFKYRLEAPTNPATTPNYVMVDDIQLGSSTVTSGTYTSPSINMGISSPIVNVGISYTVNDSTPTFQIQTASSTNGQWTTIMTSTGTNKWSTGQWMRYVLSFTVGQWTSRTTVDDVTITARSTGTYYSAINNAPNISGWDSFTATKQNNGGAHSFFIRASNTSFGVTSTTPTWTAVTSGGTPSITTGTYMQVRDDFTVTTATDNPQLDDFSLLWFEGSAADKAYGTYFKDALWWSVVAGTGSTTNNRILRYDFLNQDWTLYTLGNNGMLVRNNALYFGDPAGGYVYKYGDVENDNGSAINSYWKSKDFFADNPFVDKELVNVSVAADSIANSSMTVTYTVNGSSSTSYTMNLYDASKTIIRSNKNVPSGRTGNTFSFQFGNNAADQPFEVFAIQYGIRPKSWNPTP